MSLYPQRLAILLPDLTMGGAERSMIKLAKGIVGTGIPVDLILCRAEGEFLTEVPLTVQIVDLKASHVRHSIPALARYLKREQPTVLLACLHANIPAILTSCIVRSPTRVYVSERNTPTSESRNFNDLRMKWMPILDRIFYRRAKGVIAVSQGVARDLTNGLHIPEKLVRVIYNPVITPEFCARVNEPLSHPWFRNSAPPVILAVGRLTKQKDFSTLIRAFAQVRRMRTARLLILGEGEDRVELEQLIQDLNLEQEISLPGFVENPYPYMVQAAGFVLSSRWEGLPGVLIEALYCRVPIVATRCPSGPEEILNQGQYGRLVPVGNSSVMAQALTDLLDGKIDRPPEESWHCYELETIVNQYLQVLFGK
jgi:glycosyltransferase involved in cell wall biosynthesis